MASTNSADNDLYAQLWNNLMHSSYETVPVNLTIISSIVSEEVPICAVLYRLIGSMGQKKQSWFYMYLWYSVTLCGALCTYAWQFSYPRIQPGQTPTLDYLGPFSSPLVPSQTTRSILGPLTLVLPWITWTIWLSKLSIALYRLLHLD